MAHPFGVAGLVLNMIGAVLLIWFPPTDRANTPEGWGTSGGGTFSELPHSTAENWEGLRAFRRHRSLFRVALVLLFIGFSLQLVDLLTA